MSIFKDQWDFMQLGGQVEVLPNIDTDSSEIAGPIKQLLLYTKLIDEEASEFKETAHEDFDGHIASDIKEAVDVLVVASGYLITRLGVGKAQQAWNLVHETNLAKVRHGIDKREDGKILQSKEYKDKLKAQLMEDLQALFI